MGNIENNNLIDDIDQGTNPCNVLETRHPKERNRLGLFVLITITVLFLFIGIGLGIFFGVKNRNAIGLEVTIDPQIVSSDGSITHTAGANRFTFHGGDETQKEYSDNIYKDIYSDTYIKYVFKFENNGKVNTKYKLEFYNIYIDNIELKYQIDDGEKTTCNADEMEWIYVNIGENSQLTLYINVINKTNNAFLRGEYCLILMEVDD